MSKFKIAGATLNQIPIHWENNVSNILAAIHEAQTQQVEILCLPELCLTGYGCEDLFLSDWLSATAWDKLLAIVPHCKDIVVCVGLPIRMNRITYNGVCVIRNEKILGITLKQNLARDGVHYEPRWFDAWTAGKVTNIMADGLAVNVGDLIYEHKGILFGFEICEDAWRKDRPGFRLHERKVNLILNPSASHFALGKSELRETQVVMEGSRQFNCAYLFVNHLGNEAGRMIYDGDIVFGQHGKLLAINRRLSFQPFNLLTCDIDFQNTGESQVSPTNDSKEKNEEFARAASLALFDYLRKSKAKGFVLSLSGGTYLRFACILKINVARQ